MKWMWSGKKEKGEKTFFLFEGIEKTAVRYCAKNKIRSHRKIVLFWGKSSPSLALLKRVG